MRGLSAARAGPSPSSDYALAEKSELYPNGQAKPHERVMIEKALIRFREDKAKTARFIGWSWDDLRKTPCPWERTLAFRKEARAWRVDSSMCASYH